MSKRWLIVIGCLVASFFLTIFSAGTFLFLFIPLAFTPLLFRRGKNGDDQR